MPNIQAEVQVRPGIEGDLVALTDIYNHYVRETALTFDTTPLTPEQRLPWLRSHPEDGPHRLLVAQDVRIVGPDSILGYATSSSFTYAEVGRKFGTYWDVAWYEKRMGPGS
ncbi:GNAT family N-acetyltransferase [Streptomyces sp. NPDC014724]|uniref:GNAT family N-acetyltransferase n=1 Tax=unclassified Streptomyces TaxID=2593676 RepID=UPI0036F682F2